jgi:nicotinamidase-related amidase
MREALVVVDMLNTYEHEDGERLADNARIALPAIERTIESARDSGDELIYVNDNYGNWTSDRRAIIDQVLDAAIDRSLIEPVVPRADEPLIFKARHSIFYETSLEYLLRQREIERLTLVGQVTEQCILYSALDAYVRHLQVRVVTDAVVAIDDDLAAAALRMMERNMRAELVTAER